jgi:PKHD-type hydroxylase
MFSPEPTKIKKEKGFIAMFPSFMLHRVTPITSGIRKTLVIWICGNAFK